RWLIKPSRFGLGPLRACPLQPALVFDQLIKKASPLVWILRANQAKLQIGNGVFQGAHIRRLVVAKGHFVLQERGGGSAPNSLQNVESTLEVSLARFQFKVLQVRVAHRASQGATPISLLQVDEHSVDNVLGIFVELLGFLDGAAPCFQVSERRQVSRKIVSVANAPT